MIHENGNEWVQHDGSIDGSIMGLYSNRTDAWDLSKPAITLLQGPMQPGLL